MFGQRLLQQTTFEGEHLFVQRAVGRFGGGNDIGANIIFEHFPDRAQRPHPGCALIRRQNPNNRSRVKDALFVQFGQLIGDFVPLQRHLRQDNVQLCTDIRRQIVPEFSRRDDQIVDAAVVRFGDAVLNFKEFLAES